jgi:hypothetical protein
MIRHAFGEMLAKPDGGLFYGFHQG